MKPHSPILLTLQQPKERVWGILISLNVTGITLLGIDLNSFDDWARTVANSEDTIGLSNVFYPMHRVERVALDEACGEIESFAEQFATRVGVSVWEHLGIRSPDDVEAAMQAQEPESSVD